MPHHVVLLHGERIAQVGPVGTVRIPPGTVVRDLDGMYVIPGFVDLHVHFPADTTVHQAMLDRLLAFGITTMLNPGARPGAGIALRKRLENGRNRGPTMRTAGPIIEYPPAEEGLRGWSVEVASPSAIRDAVREQARAGVDVVKLYRQLPPALVAAAVDEAHRNGLSVIGHMGATTWREAAEAGIDMLVHSGWGTPMDELVNLDDPAAASDAVWYRGYADATRGTRFADLAAALVAHSVVVVPTLSITQAAGLGADASLLPQFRVDLAPDTSVANWWSPGWRDRHPQYDPDSEEEAELLQTVYFPGVLRIVRGYHEAGVRLGVGTDVGNSWMTPGFVYHHELVLYQEAGIPALDIVKMATYNGADALGLLDEIGTIEAGKRADLLVLGSDPLADIRHTRDIVHVFLAGWEVAGR